MLVDARPFAQRLIADSDAGLFMQSSGDRRPGAPAFALLSDPVMDGLAEEVSGEFLCWCQTHVRSSTHIENLLATDSPRDLPSFLGRRTLGKEAPPGGD